MLNVPQPEGWLARTTLVAVGLLGGSARAS